MRLFLKHNLPILVNVCDQNSYSFNILSLQKEILYIDYAQLLDRRHYVIAIHFRYCGIMCPRNRFGGGKRQVPVTLPTRGREMRVRDCTLDLNKAKYTTIQSRTVGQEQQCENRPEFKNVTDGPTDRHTNLPTNTARCRVACPQLKTKWFQLLITGCAKLLEQYLLIRSA